MKNKIFTLIGLLALTGSAWAQNPKWFKKARKTQVTVITYNAQNEITQGQGYYVDEKGLVVAEYDQFKGAVRGAIVDTEGKEHQITRIQNGNSLYNVVRFETDATKTATSQIATEALQSEQKVYIMPICSTDKKAECLIGTIAKMQEFGEGKFPYYTLTQKVESRYAGCPVFNEQGDLIGHIQMMDSEGSDKPAYVISVQYCNSLPITALTAKDPDLNAIGIAKALPDDEIQATTYLYLMNRQDQQAYEVQIRSFIEKFPKNTSGYVLLAELKALQKDYKAAEEIYAEAAGKQTQNEDELHHSFAKLLYQSGLKEEAFSEGWDMQHALKEAQAANSCNPQPIYTALEGMCLYALQQYNEAHDKFMEMAQTNMRSAQYFLYASQCKQMAKAPLEEVLALQDSAVNCFSKPYPADAASYIYLRGKTLASLKRYKEAVNDLNEFEHLTSGSVNADFCYEREQLEMQCRQFENALRDIERAVSLEPQEPLYRAEESVVNYRIGQLDEAIAAAKEAIKLNESFADAHRILGICLRDKGKTAEAKKSLQRAIELGDTAAKSVLDKMN